MSKLLISSAVLVAIAASSPIALADTSNFGHHGSHMWGGGGPGWFLGPFFMIFILAAIVALVVLVVRWLVPGQSDLFSATKSGSPTGNNPVDILKERFAKGEIDKKEFEDRRKVLEA
jgi:putative membrane protein